MVRAVIVPGNGGMAYPAPLTGNFYDDLGKRLEASQLFSEVICKCMPDPNEARRSIWIPHLKDKIGIDTDTIVIGHSSGAECAMRLAEDTKLYGIVLVAACHTDLGNAGERASGWYPPSGGDWQWKNIRRNCGFIIQYHSSNDPFINPKEARFVADNLSSEYTQFADKSHFFEPFDEVVEDVIEKAREWQGRARARAAEAAVEEAVEEAGEALQGLKVAKIQPSKTFGGTSTLPSSAHSALANTSAQNTSTVHADNHTELVAMQAPQEGLLAVAFFIFALTCLTRFCSFHQPAKGREKPLMHT